MLKELLGSLVTALTDAVQGKKKPKTNIKFGVHNHYTNNADSIGYFTHPTSPVSIGEVSVRLTDQGIVIFNLPNRLGIKEKIDLASALDSLLKQKFGVGLSFATCGPSDTVRKNELQPYYNAMKVINPNIITIFSSTKFNPEDDWAGCPKNLKVDYFVDYLASNPGPATIISDIVNPNGEGKTEPPEGWVEFEELLRSLFKTARTHKARLPNPEYPRIPEHNRK